MKREAILKQDERSELILQRLQDIIKLAYYNTDFYKKKYSAVGFEPGDLKTLNDFTRLPPLDKDEIRANFEQMRCCDVTENYMKLSTTGGSSGAPLAVYHDKRIQAEGIQQYILETLGCDISDNRGTLERYNPLKKHPLLNPLIWYPTRRCHLEATLINEKKCLAFYNECLRIRPVIFYGYVGAIHQFADYLKQHNLSLASLKVIFSTAAPLSEQNRQFMEKIFGCPVLSQYGCSEIYWLAMECFQKSGLHYFDTIRHFEIVDPQLKPLPDKEYGELLVTDLLNKVFPLIRYRNGDRACKQDHLCTCGSKFPLLAPIKGRITDMLYFPDGSSLAGDFMTTIFDDDPLAVKAFQIIQKADHSIVLRYIPGENISDVQVRVQRVCDTLASLFDNKIRNSVPIRMESVDVLPHDKGKTRFIISEVKHNNM